MNKPIAFILLAAAAMTACGPRVPQLGKSSVDEVVDAMTLEEKARLVVGTGMAGFSGENAVVGETRNLVPGAAGTTYPIARLGIPSVVLADGPAGLRINPTREGDSQTYYCTHFPIGTLLAYVGPGTGREGGRSHRQRSAGIRHRRVAGSGAQHPPQSAVRP